MKLNKIFANYFTCLFDQSLFIFSTGIKLQGEKKKTYKKRIKQILSTQDPRKIGFCMKERKKEVNLNPLLDIIHKHYLKRS